MNMEKPEKFGVVIEGKRTEELLANLEKIEIDGKIGWRINYFLKKPGDHIFFVEPKLYW